MRGTFHSTRFQGTWNGLYGPKTYATLSACDPAARIVLLIATAELYSAPATVTSEFANIFFQPLEGST